MSESEQAPKVEQATEATASTPTSSWWSPWLDVAKTKSTEVFEFVRKDLNEISTAVKSEASFVVNSTATVLKDTFKLEEPESTANSLKRSVSTFLGTVGNVLNPSPEDEGEEAILIQNDQPVPLSRFQVKLYELIKDPETFTKDLDADKMAQFESWLTISDEQMTTEKLSRELAASQDLQTHYETLVPRDMSHVDFWRRYLFRKALLEDEESLREARAKKEKEQVEKVQWEKEDFAQNIDLTEEEQMKILADYEDERKTKSDSKQLNTSLSSENLIMKEKQGMVVVADSSQVSSSSADTESKDTDDWEKDFDLEDETVVVPK